MYHLSPSPLKFLCLWLSVCTPRPITIQFFSPPSLLDQPNLTSTCSSLPPLSASLSAYPYRRAVASLAHLSISVSTFTCPGLSRLRATSYQSPVGVPCFLTPETPAAAAVHPTFTRSFHGPRQPFHDTHGDTGQRLFNGFFWGGRGRRDYKTRDITPPRRILNNRR